MSLTENDRVMVYGNKSERLPTLSELSEYINSNGNAASASKLETARAFTFSGAATGTGSFDGSSAVDIELALSPVEATNVNIAEDADNGVTADTLQATISALAARIQALENPTPP